MDWTLQALPSSKVLLYLAVQTTLDSPISYHKLFHAQITPLSCCSLPVVQYRSLHDQNLDSGDTLSESAGGLTLLAGDVPMSHPI